MQSTVNDVLSGTHYNVLDGARHIAEVDLAWPELRLCVQFDGWKVHGTRTAFVRDRASDRALSLLGWSVLRFPWEDVVRDPDRTVDELARSCEARARLARPAATRAPKSSGRTAGRLHL